MKPRISNEAIFESTGRNWDDWFMWLDQEDAMTLNHKEIVALLDDNFNLNGWWQQMISVTYEQVRGMREEGQTQAAGYEIGVSKTFNCSAEVLWKILMQTPGRDIWLGASTDFILKKKANYLLTDGREGQIRSIHENKRIRLTWDHESLNETSTLQLTIVNKLEKSTLAFHQEKLSNQGERELMRKHWKQVINRIETIIE